MNGMWTVECLYVSCVTQIIEKTNIKDDIKKGRDQRL